jgi:hypothetical protein
MEDIHLSRELLSALEDGNVSRDSLKDLAPEHLPSECTHCRAEIDAYRLYHGTHASLFAKVLAALLDRMLALGAREMPRAEQDLRTLPPLTPSQRRGKFGYSRGRFRSSALARLLLEESWHCLPDRPTEAFEFADLAAMILALNSQLIDYLDLMSLAEAYMANAHCLKNGHDTADYYFAIAREIIVEHGVTDPEVVGRVDALMSFLRASQGRLPEAEKLLQRAATQFELVGATEGAAHESI